MQTTPQVILHEGDQYIGTYSAEAAPTEFLRALILEALEYGEATAVDPEGCPVSAIVDDR